MGCILSLRTLTFRYPVQNVEQDNHRHPQVFVNLAGALLSASGITDRPRAVYAAQHDRSAIDVPTVFTVGRAFGLGMGERAEYHRRRVDSELIAALVGFPAVPVEFLESEC